LLSDAAFLEGKYFKSSTSGLRCLEMVWRVLLLQWSDDFV